MNRVTFNSWRTLEREKDEMNGSFLSKGQIRFFRIFRVRNSFNPRHWCIPLAIKQKKATTRFELWPLEFVYARLFALDGCNAWQNLALDGFEQCAAAGRDVRDLVGQAELVDAGN